jgi:hypothetical protein
VSLAQHGVLTLLHVFLATITSKHATLRSPAHLQIAYSPECVEGVSSEVHGGISQRIMRLLPCTARVLNLSYRSNKVGQ